MVRSAALILIGYWRGPRTSDRWPRPQDMVDWSWDEEDREAVADYLARGHISRSCMGYSDCRICGVKNGVLEFSDGTYVWPEGLSHYVVEHGVRLPSQFVEHVRARIDAIESSSRDEAWWASLK